MRKLLNILTKYLILTKKRGMHFGRRVIYNNIFKGKSLRMLKKFHEALDCFNKALDVHPNNGHYLNSKGNCQKLIIKVVV